MHKTFEGSHGTSRTNAKEIQRNGFKLGNGRVGKGIYFWAEQFKYLELAEYWWKQEFKKRKYKDQREPYCAILVVQIAIPEEEILDLEDRELKKRISILADKKNIGFRDWDSIGKLYNGFVKLLEKDRKTEYNLLICRVAPPENIESVYSIAISGAPEAYILKKNDYITDIVEKHK